MSKRNKKNLEVKPSDETKVAEEKLEELKQLPETLNVIVRGKFITVNKSTFMNALTKERIRRDVILKIENRIKAGEDVTYEEQTVMIVFYPAMIACSEFLTGKPFTIDEFIKLGELEMNEWYLAVVELNPHWFPQDSETLSEEDIKKNSN